MSFCSAVCCQFNHEKQKSDWTGVETGVEWESQDFGKQQLCKLQLNNLTKKTHCTEIKGRNAFYFKCVSPGTMVKFTYLPTDNKNLRLHFF